MVTSPAESPAPASAKSRQAIVFIPGMNPPWDAASPVEGLASRIVAALERNTPTSMRFRAETTMVDLPVPFGETASAQVRLTAGLAEAPLVDLYALDLAAVLREPYQDYSTKAKAFRLGKLLVIMGLRLKLLPKVRKVQKRLFEQLQVSLGALLFNAALLLLLALLLLVAGSVLADIAGVDRLEIFGVNLVVDWSLYAAAALAAGSNAPVPHSVRRGFDSSLEIIIVAGSYVAEGERRDIAVGRLASFIEALTEKHDYAALHVVSYSVGSLIALDAIFPRSPNIRRVGQVSTLVTVGCPADLVQTYWGDYFHDRIQIGQAPLSWINIFEPTDLFASNFLLGNGYVQTKEEFALLKNREVTAEGAVKGIATAGIKLAGGAGERWPDLNIRYFSHSEQGTMGKLITAMKIHRVYWDQSDTHAASSFDTVVQSLFEDLNKSPETVGG